MCLPKTYIKHHHKRTLNCDCWPIQTSCRGPRVPKRNHTSTGGRQQVPSAFVARLGRTCKIAGTAVYYDSLLFVCQRWLDGSRYPAHVRPTLHIISNDMKSLSKAIPRSTPSCSMPHTHAFKCSIRVHVCNLDAISWTINNNQSI